MDVNSDYKNSTWCWNVIGHVENSNLNVENRRKYIIFRRRKYVIFKRRKNAGFLRISNFTSRPNSDVEKRRIFYVENSWKCPLGKSLLEGVSLHIESQICHIRL